jgi:hypothetical protein
MIISRFIPRILVFPIIAFLMYPCPLQAWGCKGHQVIAFIAEKHLTPEAREFVDKLLRENPADPQLSQYCPEANPDLLAAASTWADNIRRQRTNTAPWHYINVPRGATLQDLPQFCGENGCVTQAIAEQLAILKDKNVEPSRRAEALRFVIHFVGDLHMPLHASNNNDLGGNCVPVKYFLRRPSERNNSYSPNLHSIWDVAILDHDQQTADPLRFAARLDTLFASKIDSWRNAGIHVTDWVWESHGLAESVAYRELVPKIPIELPVAARSCIDASNIGARMLALHISLGDAYQAKAFSAIEERLAQAGVRLAMILNAAVTATSR